MSTAVIITELGMTEIILSGLMVSMEKEKKCRKRVFLSIHVKWLTTKMNDCFSLRTPGLIA